jgi:hypothetical protein
MHSIIHILMTPWRHRVDFFLAIWVTMTVVAAALAAWLIGGPASARHRQGGGAVMTLPAESRPWRSRGAWLALGVFGAFLAFYIAVLLAWENFSYYDNSQFTLFTLRGIAFPPPIWIAAGRFFPLACQEFNLMGHPGASALAYHAFAILELVAVVIVLLNLDRQLNLAPRVCLIACILLAPSIVISFGGLIYPERNIVLWLVCLAFSVRAFDDNQSTFAAVTAVVCAQFMLYYKETAFLLLWGFAAGRLLLRCRDAQRPGWDFRKLRDKGNRLDLCLGALGLLFLLYYASVMASHSSLQYAQQHRRPLPQVVLDYVKMDLLAWLFVGVVIGRVYLIWKRKVEPSLLWDGLACGGLAYFGGFLGLRMFAAYYLAPVDVIAILYIGRWVFLSWEKLRMGSRFAITTALIAVLAQNIALSSFREFYRKNLLLANAEIADVIKARYQAAPGPDLRLYFPFASPYTAMEFGAYLSYCGLPVEGVEAGRPGSGAVELFSPALTKDGPLQDYRSVMGHAARAPKPGDLVIVLPDDNASDALIAPYREGRDVLLYYQPSPRLPGWMRPVMRDLHIASPVFVYTALPDDWLQSSVTLWQNPKKP